MVLMEIHESEVIAVQIQPAFVLTAVVDEPPPAPIVRVCGLSEYWQPLPPPCVTVSVRPAIVSVPVRCEVTVDAATVNVTLPLPLPVDPFVTVIHETLLCDVQLQAAVVATADDPVPPPPTTANVEGVIAYEHAAAA